MGPISMKIMLTSVFFRFYGRTEAVFCKAFLTTKVDLIAIFGKQTETGIKERETQDFHLFICGGLVSKFKGTGLSLCANV